MSAGRLVVGLIVAAFALISYFGTSSQNSVTGEKQRVAMSPQQEVALGVQSAPQMAAQFGGLSANAAASERVKRIGAQLVSRSVAAQTPYKFSFHLLADRGTVNAFALPGGPIFITEGLLRLLRTEGQLAAVLGHEIGHVIARHSSEHLAKAQLTQGLIGAAVIGTGDYSTAQIGQVVGNMINMRYGREDELESDALGIRVVAEAGYDPRAMIAVMEVLAKASGPSRQPEMLSTHPNPDNRAARIREQIEKTFAGGVPAGLKP
jgi:predicted Zn-dependent protease